MHCSHVQQQQKTPRKHAKKPQTKAQREEWHTIRTYHCVKPCSTIQEHQERKECTKTQKESSKRDLHVIMFNNTKKESIYKNPKGKLKERACMQPCSTTKLPRKKAYTKTQKESSKTKHACMHTSNHVQQQQQQKKHQERKHAHKYKRKYKEFMNSSCISFKPNLL
jgi:hypothetical protein